MRLSRDPAARRRLGVLAGLAAVALVAGLALGGNDPDGGGDSGSSASAPAALAERLSLRRQAGQLTVSTFSGRRLPAWMRRRLAAGETAGVILFGGNATTPADWRGLTRAIQRAAHGSALVMVDQEGGDVRTVGWAGPAAGQPLQGDPAGVRAAAAAAGRQLHAAGVDVDLAPVADVASGPTVALVGRTFPGGAADVAARTRASVEGFRSAGVAATAKHFPGLGAAVENTDDASVSIAGPVDDALVPFRAAVAARVPLVMISHAVYPDVDPDRVASQSRPVVTGLLRRRLGFRGVAITDSIEAQAVLDRTTVGLAAERSVDAGVDLVLTTGSASWKLIHPRLLERARRDARFRARIRAAVARVLALKRSLGLRAVP
jgi:beta-N-acetylhexosaminidase